MAEIPQSIKNAVSEFRYHAAEFGDVYSRLQAARNNAGLPPEIVATIDDKLAKGQKLRTTISSTAQRIDNLYRGSQQVSGLLDVAKNIVRLTPFAPVVTAAGYGWDALHKMIMLADSSLQEWTNSARAIGNAANEALKMQAQGWSPDQVNRLFESQSAVGNMSRALKWAAILVAVGVAGYAIAPHIRRLGK